MTLADKIVVLRDGIVEQVGSPVELYETPDNMFVVGFIGSPKMNFFKPAALSKSPSKVAKRESDEDIIGIRPEHLIATTKTKSIVTAKFELIENLGELVLAHFLTSDGESFIAKIETAPDIALGEELQFTAENHRIHVFDSKSAKSK